MPTSTIAQLPELPSLQALEKRLTREWDFGAGRRRAVETAREVHDVLRIRPATIDLERDLKVVWHAASVLWDSKAFADAVKLVGLWRETVEVVAEEQRIDVTEARIWAVILSAELEHRLRRYDQAVHYGLTALDQIRTLANGEQKLREMLGLGALTPITEMYCAALAIAIPAGRMHFKRKPALRLQHLDRWIEDAQLILHRDLPPPLFRIHALVIQTFFAIAERGRTASAEEWLDRLERFDDLVRPRTPRGLATKRLRHVARARFDGDTEREFLEAQEASRDLEDLPRHTDTLTANQWWPVEMARQVGQEKI